MFPKEIRHGFDNIPDIYDRVRPRYPAAAFDEIFVRLPPSPPIIEIGPGTGQATRDLLARGAHVLAVELGAAMAAKLQSNFRDEPGLEILVSSFEAAPVPAAAFDALFSATAYWWVSSPERMTKPVQILKRPAGLMAILDTMQVDAEADRGYFERSHAVYETHGVAPSGGYHRAPPPDAVVPPIVAELEQSPLYRDVELYRYRADQTYSTSQYADLVRTYSGSQAMTDHAREALIADLSGLIDAEFGGTVTKPLVMTLALANLA
jgi:SAM-dependent methyltransferase